jgi:hypothetical protein
MSNSQSVVIDNLYVKRLGRVVWPLKAQTPLLVDPDTELPLPVTAKCLEVVARQAHQVAAVPGVE